MLFGLAFVTAAAASCPQLAGLRSPSVVEHFHTADVVGLWYEQAYIDVAQVGASCQTLNATSSDDGTITVDFSVRYGRLPFHLDEIYTPVATSAVFTKRAGIPGGKLLRLPTVVVDVTQESLILFSCLAEPLLPTVTELVIASRTRNVTNAFVEKQLNLSHALGVPFAEEKVKRVAC